MTRIQLEKANVCKVMAVCRNFSSPQSSGLEIFVSEPSEFASKVLWLLLKIMCKKCQSAFSVVNVISSKEKSLSQDNQSVCPVTDICTQVSIDQGRFHHFLSKDSSTQLVMAATNNLIVSRLYSSNPQYWFKTCL